MRKAKIGLLLNITLICMGIVLGILSEYIVGDFLLWVAAVLIYANVMTIPINILLISSRT